MDHFLTDDDYYDIIVVGTGLWQSLDWSLWDRFEDIYSEIDMVRQMALDNPLLRT